MASFEKLKDCRVYVRIHIIALNSMGQGVLLSLIFKLSPGFVGLQPQIRQIQLCQEDLVFLGALFQCWGERLFLSASLHFCLFPEMWHLHLCLVMRHQCWWQCPYLHVCVTVSVSDDDKHMSQSSRGMPVHWDTHLPRAGITIFRNWVVVYLPVDLKSFYLQNIMVSGLSCTW